MDWQKKEIGPELVNEIKRKYGCDPLTSAILVRRGIIEGKDILFYLEDEKHVRCRRPYSGCKRRRGEGFNFRRQGCGRHYEHDSSL